MTMSVFRKLMLSVLAFLVVAATASSQTPPPAVFFTDISSGPNLGGESVSGYAGAYVTVYGNNFGSSQSSSTITWNNLNCLRVVSWGTTWLWYQKIVVQLGSSCTLGTGNFVVTVNGVASNAATENTSGGTQIPSRFTVRSTGNIYCVSTSGNDSNSGKFPSSCWKTIVKGRQISAGDITYVENGVTQTATDGFASLTINGTGTAASPMALVAYPGATATIGAITGNDGVRFCSGYSACSSGGSYWTIAGFVLRGANAAISISGGTFHYWFVGNDISCPNGVGLTACVTNNNGGYTYMYGNNVHDSGATNSTKTYHSVYLSTNVNDNWLGWNSVSGGGACRGIQFYSTGGSDQYDLHVHDNLIYNIRCDGINFSTVNPNNGPVEAYNNVIYNAGAGPAPSDGDSNYSCIRTGSSGSPTTPADIYNNTLYNCGARKLSGGSGAGDWEIPTRLRNNIVDQSSGEAYLFGTTCGDLSGSNNLWFGVGAPPCTLAGNLNVDPQLVNPAGANFQLSSASASIGAGTAVSGLSLDFAGLLRPSPPSIGAYEYASGVSVQRPAPPTNLTLTVN